MVNNREFGEYYFVTTYILLLLLSPRGDKLLSLLPLLLEENTIMGKKSKTKKNSKNSKTASYL
jgi:hypothetical protein